MTINDYLTVLTLTRAYNLRPTLLEVLEGASRFSDDDLTTASDILRRVPDHKLVTCAASPDFGPALDRLIGTAPDPRNRAVAFLKLGVPVRGLILPSCVRDMIAADVHAAGGKLFLAGMALDLAGTTNEQKDALRQLAERGMIPSAPAGSR